MPAHKPSAAAPGFSCWTSSRRLLMRTSADRSAATRGSPVPSMTPSSALRTFRLPSHDIGQNAFSAMAQSRCSWDTLSCPTPDPYFTERPSRSWLISSINCTPRSISSLTAGGHGDLSSVCRVRCLSSRLSAWDIRVCSSAGHGADIFDEISRCWASSSLPVFKAAQMVSLSGSAQKLQS